MGTGHGGRRHAAPGPGGPDRAEGLRARKKRELRRRLSDVATRLFLERGFGGVRIAEIAAACEVSEATVFNYFPTKESLLLDRLDGTASAIVDAVGDREQDPVTAVTGALDAQLRHLLGSAAAGTDEVVAIEGIHRFGELIRTTPSLRAHLSDRRDRCTRAAAARLAARYHLDAHEPRALVSATALLGLWQVQSDALLRHSGSDSTLADLTRHVHADLEAAARLLTDGLRTLPSS